MTFSSKLDQASISSFGTGDHTFMYTVSYKKKIEIKSVKHPAYCQLSSRFSNQCSITELSTACLGPQMFKGSLSETGYIVK